MSLIAATFFLLLLVSLSITGIAAAVMYKPKMRLSVSDYQRMLEVHEDLRIKAIETAKNGTELDSVNKDIDLSIRQYKSRRK